MNVENIRKVADAIEQHSIPDLGFNMNMFCNPQESDFYGKKCGTVGCIGGWAKIMFGELNAGPAGTAKVHFDLPSALAAELCYAYGSELHLSAIGPQQAVAVLRHLADTGEVDWSITHA